MFGDEKGQAYIFEALIACLILLGSVFFVLNLKPASLTEYDEFADLQLKKFADDVLELMCDDFEETYNKPYNGTLYIAVKSGISGSFSGCTGWSCFDDNFSKIEKILRDNLSILLKAEVFNSDGYLLHCNGSICNKNGIRTISSFKILFININGSIDPYEVRLSLCYI